MEPLAIDGDVQVTTSEQRRGRVLVVGSAQRGASLPTNLDGLGCDVVHVASGAAALSAVRHEPCDLALFHLEAVADEGLALVPRLLAEQPGLDVVVVSADPTLESAVEAVRVGAKDYLPAPLGLMRIRELVDDNQRSRRQGSNPPRRAGALAPPRSASPAMRAVLRELDRVTASDLPVLLRGERGSGKSVLARALHAAGPRRDGPFVGVSCGGRSEEQLSRELFGWAIRAFPGAMREEKGRVESADGGTLFLDGLGTASPELEARLVRLVRHAEFERLGDGRLRTADVRLIASSSDGRQEGFARSTPGFEARVIAVPPLRDRVEDIPRLAWTFASSAARRFRKAVPGFSPEVERKLRTSRWPGNVSELRSAVERAVLATDGDTVLPEAFPDFTPGGELEPRLGGDFSLEDVTREHIQRVIARAPTLREAADILRVDPSTLYRWRRKSVVEPSARPLLPLAPQRRHGDAENA